MRIKDFLVEIFVFLFSLVIRLPSLGWDIFNADAFLWKARSYNFSSAIFSLDFSKTAQTAHPGVSLMWLSTLAIKVYSGFNRLFRSGAAVPERQEIFELHFVQKLILVFVISLLISLSFYLLTWLTNSWIAFFSTFLLTLEPYFLAHTRVYHLDALLSMLMFVSVLVLLVYLSGEVKSPKEKNHGEFGLLALSAIFATLALLTKSTGLFLIPFVGLILLVRFVSRGISLKCSIRVFTYYLLLVTGYFFLFWPAMWVQPLKTLNLYLSGISGEGFGEHGQVVFGIASADPGLLFYPLSLWLRLSPWLLGLAVLEVLGLIRGVLCHSGALSERSESKGDRISGTLSLRSRVTKKDLVFFVSLLFIFLYLVFISIPSKKLERYTLPVNPFLAILAGLGLYRLGRFLGRWRTKKINLSPSTGSFLVSLLFVLFVLSVYRIHPDYLAYYSPFAGGLGRGVQVIQPDWAIAAWRVGEYLNSRPDPQNLRILVPETNQFRPFIEGDVFDSSGISDLHPFDYVVLPVWGLKGRFENIEPEKVIEINGVPVYNIYRVAKISS